MTDRHAAGNNRLLRGALIDWIMRCDDPQRVITRYYRHHLGQVLIDGKLRRVWDGSTLEGIRDGLQPCGWRRC